MPKYDVIMLCRAGSCLVGVANPYWGYKWCWETITVENSLEEARAEASKYRGSNPQVAAVRVIEKGTFFDYSSQIF